MVGAAGRHDGAAVVVHATQVGDLTAVRAHQRSLLLGGYVEAAHAAARGGGQHAGAIGRQIQASDSVLVLGLEEELVEVEWPHLDHVVGGTGDHAADVAGDREDGGAVALEDALQLGGRLVDLEDHSAAGAHLDLLEGCVRRIGGGTKAYFEVQAVEGRIARVVVDGHRLGGQTALLDAHEADVLATAANQAGGFHGTELAVLHVEVAGLACVRLDLAIPSVGDVLHGHLALVLVLSEAREQAGVAVDAHARQFAHLDSQRAQWPPHGDVPQAHHWILVRLRRDQQRTRHAQTAHRLHVAQEKALLPAGEVLADDHVAREVQLVFAIRRVFVENHAVAARSVDSDHSLQLQAGVRLDGLVHGFLDDRRPHFLRHRLLYWFLCRLLASGFLQVLCQLLTLLGVFQI